MNKTIAIWIAVFGGTFVVLFFLIRLTAPKSEATVYPEVSVVNAEDHTKGPVDSKTVLVEYGDFQCPGCAQYEPLVQKLLTDYSDRFLFIYRNFPLPSHDNAVVAAKFAESAGQQGKFWEMHDKIFAEQNAWKNLSDSEARAMFVGYGTSLGLDATKLTADADSDAVKQKIDEDQRGGFGFKVSSTPTFFLNGAQIRPQTYDEFKALIETALSL